MFLRPLITSTYYSEATGDLRDKCNTFDRVALVRASLLKLGTITRRPLTGGRHRLRRTPTPWHSEATPRILRGRRVGARRIRGVAPFWAAPFIPLRHGVGGSWVGSE